MHKVHEKSVADCLECELPAQERLNYFTGQFLAERDFRLEQDYLIGKHRQHNRFLHGWGTVCGLKVVQHPTPECRDRFVVIEPGLALDCCGREIAVREEVYVDLARCLAPVNPDEGVLPGRNLLISICYAECKTEHVPALYSECGCEEGSCEPSRVREGYEVKVERVNTLPESPEHEEVGVSLSWTTTLNLDHATRLALDTTAERLFVLTSADPGQIMVYDTDHHCLLRTIDIQAQGVDLAISPTGRFLYVLRHVGAAPGDYFLRVIDVQNLNSPVTVNDLPLSSGALTSAPKVAVAAADGRVYTLDPNATPNKKVTIWKTTINTAGVNPTLPLTNPASPKFAEVVTGADARDIAVSPDGIWLFIAEAAPADKKVTAAKVQTLTGSSPVTHSIAVADTPVLLAISGDSLRLFVVSAGKKVRAFSIQETPSPFPEVGSGVDVGPDDPVAAQSSPSGKWVYVLSKDAANKGWVRAVNGEKFETDPTNAVGDPGPVVASPQDLLLAPDGREVYVAGDGLTGQCGGVSVLDVSEEPCAEIFWRALEGCPTCPEDWCVPLAAIRDYTDGQTITDLDIDNRIRPLVPSTETLREVILCALEHGTGTQGPEGPRGLAGLPGADGARWFDGIGAPSAATGVDGDYYLNTVNGDVFRKVAGAWTSEGNIKGPKGDPGVDSVGPPGPGLEAGLTRITALSWNHNTGGNQLVDILQAAGARIGQGFVIGFSNPVLVANPSNPFLPPNQVDAEHVFEVLIQNPRDVSQGLRCWCSVSGRILPVDFTTDNPQATHINRGVVVPGPNARGAAFLLPERTLSMVREANEVWVRLRGDFVIDGSGRAVDAEFARAALPSGDRPAASNFGIQGGLFESWLWIGDRTPPQFTGRLVLNNATVAELTTLPGISERIAEAIVDRRRTRPFERIDDLTEIRGLSPRILDNIRDRISMD